MHTKRNFINPYNKTSDASNFIHSLINNKFMFSHYRNEANKNLKRLIRKIYFCY